MKILVLCGGTSAERVVSLASGDAVAGWLRDAGYEVLKFDPERPDSLSGPDVRFAPTEIGLDAPTPMYNGQLRTSTVKTLIDVIERVRPDVVFPIFHGGYGENGTLQAVLDWIGIPYTGSGMLASAMAMNKEVTCARIRAAGVPVPKGFAVRAAELGNTAEIARKVAEITSYPAVVKPLNGGSTVGLSKVTAESELPRALEAVKAQGDDAIIEAHFTGRETTVTVIDGEAFPVIEIRPKAGFYDYSNKYTSGRTEYLCPAPLDADLTDHLKKSAEIVFRAMGCAGFARVDFLVAEHGDFVCLEINTLPGMTTHSLVPKSARAGGLEPPALMRKLVESALRARAGSTVA